MSGIMLGDSPAKLYLGDILLTGSTTKQFLLSTDGAYIKTGLFPDNNTRVSYYVEFFVNQDFDDSLNSWSALFGGGQANVQYMRCVMVSKTYGFTVQNGAYYENGALSLTPDKIYGMYNVNKGTVFFESDSSPAVNTPIKFATQYESYGYGREIYLFARSMADTPDAICVGVAISRFCAYDSISGTLLCDMTPAVNPETGDPAMYDSIRDIYLENANSTGSFSIITR